MREIKQSFLFATTLLAFAAPAAHAAGVPVLDLPASAESQALTLSQPGTAFAAAPDAQQAALLAPAPQVQPVAAVKEPAPSLVPESSNWMMLLVGAGVMLLPRHRRPDNAVR